MDERGASFGLFGRDDALRFVHEPLAGGGSAVAVGEPGTGKTSLLRAAALAADRQGRRVLSVTPTQFDRGLPFAGLAELIVRCPEGADEGLPDPQRRALAVAVHRVDPDGRDADALAVPLAVRGLLRHLCESEPVALIIDDLQWLDPASVGSLGFALRSVAVEPARLGILVGTRPEGAGSDLIRSLPDPRHEFALQPLDDEAIGQLLRQRVGPRWTPPMSAGVAKASGGNPLLALEIARAMEAGVQNWNQTARHHRDPVLPVPRSLAELLDDRVARLPDDVRQILLLVAAAGRLTVLQLQALVGDEVLRRALDAGADADVATVDVESVVVFTHPLLASAIYDAAEPAARRRAHRVLSEALDDPVERARHRWRSTSAPDEAVADELERAADIAEGRGGEGLVGELLEEAALATPSTVDAAVGLSRWLRTVDAHLFAGDQLKAQSALDRGSALAVLPEQQCAVLLRRVRLAADISLARSLAEQGFELAPEGSEVRAEILLVLGTVCQEQGFGERALEVTEMAVMEAAALQRADIQVRALLERVIVERHWAVGDPLKTLRDVDRLVEVAGIDPRSPFFAWPRSFYSAWNDDKAEKRVRDSIALAIETGRYGELSQLYITLIVVLIRESRVREAQAALDEANRLGAWAGTTDSWAQSDPQQAIGEVFVREYTGDLDGAREWAQAAVARPEISGSPYWRSGFLMQLGFIEVSARNWQAALDHLRTAADVFESSRMVDLEALLWGVDYADAALQVGATEDVEAAIAVLRRQGSGSTREAAVAADRVQALLDAARGDVDGAVHELQRIVDQPGAECPFEAARSRLALGQVLRRAGHKGRATEVLNAAAETFDELATPRWAERARDEAARVGLRPTTGSLTATERRVAELVGLGRSNQETAAELFMSAKTVEANLTRIYRKLAVRSRTELANRVKTLDPPAVDSEPPQ